MAQFTLYSHDSGPNGWKTVIVLEELGLTYETKYLQMMSSEAGGIKSPDFLKLNPNGRIPCIVDHKNNDFVLWESGAIFEYLTDKYDPEGKLKLSGDDKYKVIQWLDFQISGQGPYFGQAAWFNMFHPEKIPSVIERYGNEVTRVLGVLELGLSSSKGSYLCGDKVTAADLAFIPWNDTAMKYFVGGVNLEKEYPHVVKWHASLMARPSVKKTFADKEALLAKKSGGH